MGHIVRRAASGAATLALAGMAVPAQASCWAPETIGAAQLTEFHLRITVAHLRCNAAQMPFADDLTEFFNVHGERVQAAENVVRAEFTTLYRSDKRAFDRYMTNVGNRYGDGRTDRRACTLFGDMLDELTAVDDGEKLQLFASVMVREPMIEDACPVTIAHAGDE